MKALRGQPSIYEKKENRKRPAELEIRGLSLSFGGVKALSDVDLRVKTGEFFAVIGPNGAGKTSLMNCITGFYHADAGSILFNGKEIVHLHSHELVRLGIGRTFQNIELFPGMTVISNLFLARHTHYGYGFLPACFFLKSVRNEEIAHRRVLEEIIDFLEIQSVRNKPVGSLPYGLMKRIELGRALALEPALLILDEPFAGMNLEEKEDMVRFLLEINRAWGQTIILVEHDMAVVMSIAQRIAVLNFGQKLTEGPPAEIVKNPEVVKAYLGDDSIV
jgi:branched-chain amino acid transport system ATP-binding protein